MDMIWAMLTVISMFPMFDADMRKSMYQEVILFFEEFFQKNCSAWDLIDADYTYVNGALADA